MKALVTGGGGFLGRYVVELLASQGHLVRVVARRRYPELDRLGVESLQGDLRSPEVARAACRGIDVVFHTAAVAGIWGPWRHYYEINTVATRNVIAGCLAERVPKLVHTSSPSVTFGGGDQEGVDESVPYPEQWLCHYPHTKAIAEREVLAADGRDGLRTCALRPHLIWGPRDPHLVPRLLARARAGRLRRVGDGSNLVDMVYVENAAVAHLLAAERLEPGSPVCGRAYFISQGEPVNCWQWIDQILARAGLPPVRKSLSFAAAWRLGAAMEMVFRALRLPGEPPMTRFLALQLARHHYFDIRRACSDLGYQPSMSAAEGMDRLAEELARGGAARPAQEQPG